MALGGESMSTRDSYRSRFGSAVLIDFVGRPSGRVVSWLRALRLAEKRSLQSFTLISLERLKPS